MFANHKERLNAEFIKKETGGKYFTEKQLNHKFDEMIKNSNDPKQIEALKRLKF